MSSCSPPTDITDSWSQLASVVQSGSWTVAIVLTANGSGYWETQANGTVAAFGSAQNYGSLSGQLNSPIVGMASTPDGKGYWLVGSDGGIFSFGDATFYGSTGSLRLNKPIVGIATTPNGKGYWMVASDGGIFSFGDAEFFGSMGGKPLNQPIVGIVADPATGGYWEVATDGGIFSYNVLFYGSTGSIHLNKPIVGMEASPNGQGYRFVASDGGDCHLRTSALQGQHRQPEPGGTGRRHGGRQCHQRVLDGGGRRRHLHLRRCHLLRASRQHGGLTGGGRTGAAGSRCANRRTLRLNRPDVRDEGTRVAGRPKQPALRTRIRAALAAVVGAVLLSAVDAGFSALRPGRTGSAPKQVKAVMTGSGFRRSGSCDRTITSSSKTSEANATTRGSFRTRPSVI